MDVTQGLGILPRPGETRHPAREAGRGRGRRVVPPRVRLLCCDPRAAPARTSANSAGRAGRLQAATWKVFVLAEQRCAKKTAGWLGPSLRTFQRVQQVKGRKRKTLLGARALTATPDRNSWLSLAVFQVRKHLRGAVPFPFPIHRVFSCSSSLSTDNTVSAENWLGRDKRGVFVNAASASLTLADFIFFETFVKRKSGVVGVHRQSARVLFALYYCGDCRESHDGRPR